MQYRDRNRYNDEERTNIQSSKTTWQVEKPKDEINAFLILYVHLQSG